MIRQSGSDAASLIFTGEMYGLQLDHLARLLGGSQRAAAGAVSRWTTAGLADSGRLGPGLRWVWLTRAGLSACGLPYTASVPALSQIAHLRAVSSARLALAATSQFSDHQAYWRSERRIRSKFGRKIALREHVPDGEVHWPETAGPGVLAPAWAGECWAIEAELTPKTVAKTVTIMRELLTRTGDYGCEPDNIVVPGRAPRHARAIYLCSPRAWPVVARARDAAGEFAGRIEIRLLPPDAFWRPDPLPAP